MRNKYFRFALFFLMFAALLGGAGAHAQKILQAYEKPLPDIAPMEATAFEQATTLHTATPYKDETLAYQVRLPKDWQTDSSQASELFGLSNRVLTVLSSYNSPPQIDAPPSFFRVEALTLDYQTTTLQWFLPWAQERGLTLEGLKEHEDGKVEAIYVTLEKDNTYITRILAQINGKNLIVAEFSSPAETWQKEKPLQAAAVQSFTLLHKKSAIIEEMKPHTFLDIAQFSYPVSWTLEAETVKTTEQMSAKLTKGTGLVNAEGKGSLNGQINISLISRESVDDLSTTIEEYKKALEVTGLVMADKIEKITNYKLNDSIRFAQIEAYKAHDTAGKLVAYELWLAVMAAGDYYYFISLLTPARDDSYTQWARNGEVYKLVVESVKPGGTPAQPQ